ncbi:hypothetical protein [Sinanaerobacter chloroacetimidivorans]|uniref:JAB domain-containing protein n=1 Tax=Sinanaerobacter chloroacetimidivorans TaxID=2818044 RepID=A0A8J7W0L6_9FIRM|nr:hypothetical protein [Sinanaerobacter chloroacetimidivorans]MBR0598592.1 hypothetical protein [Sinanaerobacter chloroacetimidivorans]
MMAGSLFFREISVPRRITTATEEFSRKKGKEGFEARVYWIGTRQFNNTASITRVFMPRQLARKTIFGVSVEIPEEGNLELIESLKKGELALVKLHTHPREAYLSETDIANPFFRHEGAISIVVPNFCRNPLSDLTGCSVNVFNNGQWCSLSKKQIITLFRVGG